MGFSSATLEARSLEWYLGIKYLDGLSLGSAQRPNTPIAHTAQKPYKASSIWNPNVRGSHIKCTKPRQTPRGPVM